MKIHIAYNFREGPWGGGNQFLKNLKSGLININSYTENLKDADLVLFNGHQGIDKIPYLKFRYPGLKIVLRIDGIMGLHRKDGIILDKKIFKMANICDGLIFQSKWAYNEAVARGVSKGLPSVVILNAPNSNLFSRENKKKYKDRKFTIVSSSWSTHLNKGHSWLLELDKYCDFSHTEIIFIGNTVEEFKNIIKVGVKNSEEIAKIYENSDVFFTASINDACSNSLIEAIHSGLIPIGVNSGGNPEIIGSFGKIFEVTDDVNVILSKLNEIRNNIEFYNNQKHKLPTIHEVTSLYYDFFDSVVRQERHVFVTFFDFIAYTSKYHLLDKIQKIYNRITK